MRPLLRTLGSFAFLTALLVAWNLPAQDAEEKKDEKKGDDSPKKKVIEKKVDEKVVYGQKLQGKVVRVEARTIYFATVDPAKMAQVNQWWQQQQVQLARSPQNRPQVMQQYSQKIANEIYGKDFEVRVADRAKVRTAYEPFLYDEESGNPKKLTLAEKKNLKDKDGASNVPGYYADFDTLRPGQMAELYMAKVAAPPKTTVKIAPKKKIDLDAVEDRVVPEAVMIVIVQDAQRR